MSAPTPDRLKLVKELPRPVHTFAAGTVDFKTAYLGSSDFTVSEIDLCAAKPEPKELYGHQSYVTGVALAGSVLISVGYDGKLMWWDTSKKELLRTTDAHSKWIRKVAASPDGKHVASVADDMV